MKKCWILIPAFITMITIVLANKVWGGCYECPLDAGCNSTQCPQGTFGSKPNCGTYIVFEYNHYVCIQGTSKNSCSYRDPMYACAKKYLCWPVQRPDGKWVCNTSTYPDSLVEVQSTDCS